MPPTSNAVYIASETPVIAQNDSFAPETIKDLILKYADEFEADKLLALNIAWCESQFDYDAKNSKSSAKGVYQFVNSTWDKYCKGDPLNPHDNIKCGLKLQAQGKYGHWSESVNCWKKIIF